MPKVNRRMKIISMIEERRTLQEIGDELGVCRERARQLINSYGFTRKHEHVKVMRGAKREEVKALLCKKRTVNSICKVTGLTPKEVRSVIKDEYGDGYVPQYDMLWDPELGVKLYTVDRYTAAQVASVFGVHRMTVANYFSRNGIKKR